MTWEEAMNALQYIAEGYAIEVREDRYIAVENPDFEEGDGSNPYLVIDVWELPSLAIRMTHK